MRLSKMLGLVGLATVIAMALVGTSPVGASVPTQLCDTHSSLTCATNGTTEIHLVLAAGQVSRLLSSLATVLCLDLLLTATPLALANPQNVHILNIEHQNCGTNSAHTNCEMETEEAPLSNLLKTGLDEGTLTAINGQLRVICENIFGFIDIDCKYNLTGVLLAFAAQHGTANEAQITEVGDKSLCPNSTKIDHLLKTLKNTYVLK